MINNNLITEDEFLDLEYEFGIDSEHITEDDIDEELHKMDLTSLDIGSKSNNKSVDVVGFL